MSTQADILPMSEPKCTSATTVKCERRWQCLRYTTHTPPHLSQIRQLRDYEGGARCKGYIALQEAS